MIDPTEDNWRTIAEDFATTCQFPNCIGAIDGKHVVIQVHYEFININSGSLIMQ